MALRPRVKGRVYVERDGDRYVLRASLELEGSRFIIPGGASIDAEASPATIEYRVLLHPGRYYNPLYSPLPRPANPYVLVDFSIVYEHEPMLRLVHGPQEVQSTIVLTSTGYTMVDGLAYPHLLLYRDGRRVELGEAVLVAYPVLTGDEAVDAYIKAEYEALAENRRHPYLHAAIVACNAAAGCKLEELWRRRRGIARLANIPRDWLEVRGFSLERVEPVDVSLEGGVVRLSGYGIVALKVECGGDTFVLEALVEGERMWKPWDGCSPRISSYSSLCPLCLQPP